MSRRRTHQIIGGACATAVLLVTAACSGDPSHDKPDSKQPPASAPKRTSYDPPRSFSRSHPVLLPEDAGNGKITLGGVIARPLPITLFRTTAYIAAQNHLLAVDTTTGKYLANVRPRHESLNKPNEFSNDNPAEAPAISTIDAKTEVIVPFLVRISGSGTTAGHNAVEITGVDTTPARKAWSTQLTLPQWAQNSYSHLATTAVGAENGIAVIQVSDEEHAVTYAVNLTTHKKLWTKNLASSSVVGDVVVGLDSPDNTDEQHAKGIDLSTGAPRWTAEQVGYGSSTSPAGPNLALFTGSDYGDGDAFAQLLDARTGKVASVIHGGTSSLSCNYAGKSVTVCYASRGERAFGIDADSAKLLWQLPDSDKNRVAPDVSAVHNGIVYGTTENGPILLNAQTGADINASPKIAPVIVNGYAGIALDGDHNNVVAYRTTG